MWAVITSFMDSMPEDYVEAKNHFRVAAVGNSTYDRWKRCIDGLQGILSMPMGLLFVNAVFDEDSKTRVRYRLRWPF